MTNKIKAKYFHLNLKQIILAAIATKINEHMLLLKLLPGAIAVPINPSDTLITPERK